MAGGGGIERRGERTEEKLSLLVAFEQSLESPLAQIDPAAHHLLYVCR